MEYGTLVSYPLMFIPAMIYASVKSRNNSFTRNGRKLDSRHFSPLGGALCALCVVLATLALAFCVEPLLALLPEMPEALEELLKGMTQDGSILINFLTVSIFAPFFEEWLCRGMVLRGLLGNGVKPVWAIVISALFFAFIHLNPWQAIPAFLLGCLFGYVYYKTGSLILTMIIHFVNNGTAVVLSNVESLKDYDYWIDILGKQQYTLVFIASCVVLAACIAVFSRIKVENPWGNIDRIPPADEVAAAEQSTPEA